MRLALLLLPTCAVLGACASVLRVPGLEGTSWRLVRFETPGDNAAILKPADTKRYTLRFDQDGRLGVKLDCNRGTGPWQAVATDARGGSLRIGPLATTRAMCPPDPVGARLAQDLDAISSYRLQDGRLYTSLPVDAGTYVWEPDAP